MADRGEQRLIYRLLISSGRITEVRYEFGTKLGTSSTRRVILGGAEVNIWTEIGAEVTRVPNVLVPNIDRPSLVHRVPPKNVEWTIFKCYCGNEPERGFDDAYYNWKRVLKNNLIGDNIEFQVVYVNMK